MGLDRNRLIKRIEAVEGKRNKMYSLNGVPHIGIGHNIVSRSLEDSTLEFLGIEDESDLIKKELTDEQCYYLLDRDLDIAISDVQQLIGGRVFDDLSGLRQEVLIDMSFNLGRPRLSKFKNMLAAVKSGNFKEAGAEILDSKAARDPLTRKRYQALASEMSGDSEPTIDPFVSIQSGIAESDIQKISSEDLMSELLRRIKGGV